MKARLIKIIYILLIAVYIVSLFKTKALPPKSGINQELFNEPIQIDATGREDFSFDYRNKNYHVKPLADYELWGLVVTKNNIGAWYNYYHDENSVNLKDVCVIWGDNIDNEVYLDKKISFKSGEWTCYYQWSGALKEKFYPNKLSNNHLLSADEEIQKVIRNINIGDQIYLKGALVDYAEEGHNYYRETSLSRDDTNQSSRSGGACEVFYVDEIKIFNKNQLFWNYAKPWSKRLFFSFIAAQILFMLYTIRRKRIGYTPLS